MPYRGNRENKGLIGGGRVPPVRVSDVYGRSIRVFLVNWAEVWREFLRDRAILCLDLENLAGFGRGSAVVPVAGRRV